MPSGQAPPPGTARPGDKLDGKYTLVRVLGTGGMGVVFEAEHLRLKQRCAIKMLSPDMLRDTDIVRRFEREARASALLKSPHVTRVTDVATTPDGIPYMVMELLDGHDLDSELETRKLVPYADAVDYVLQACAAVGEAHSAGIIHRDLKPGNLFLARDDERTIVKVLDFGISKMVEDEARLTRAGMTMGTTLYMSPEQLRSAAKVDARSDIWSLGIILYELVCGSPPFVGSTTQVAAAIVCDDAPDITKRCPIPAELGAAIHRALRRAPDERFASIAELAAALAPFAPPDSIGRAVAAQLSRRSSGRQLLVDSSTAPNRKAQPRVDVEARTLAHDVSTSAPHAVDSVAGRPSSRRALFVVLASVAAVGAIGAAIAGIVFVRNRGAAHESAAASAAIAPSELPVAPIATASVASVASAETAPSAAPTASMASSPVITAPPVTTATPGSSPKPAAGAPSPPPGHPAAKQPPAPATTTIAPAPTAPTASHKPTRPATTSESPPPFLQ